jgi:hypothetical protein
VTGIDFGDSDGGGGGGDGGGGPIDLLPPGTDGPRLDGGMMDPNGPIIEIVSPLPVPPAMVAEVGSNTLVVRAKITAQGGRTLASDTLKLAVPTSTGGVSTTLMSLTATKDVYEGTADVGGLNSGSTNFVVEAKDSAGNASSKVVDYIHDGGPKIIFLSPNAPTAKGSTTLDVLLQDTLHTVSKVKATIRVDGDVIAANTAPTMISATLFQATTTIDFNDTMKFSPALVGPQIVTVEAENSSGVKNRASKQFIVDNAGPAIVIDKPTPGQFVGGVVTVQATLTDVSPINASSVKAVFANDPTKVVNLTETAPNSGKYAGDFDVRQLPKTMVLPTVSVRADDVLGNHGETAEVIVIDTTRPRMELDPPWIRAYKADATTAQCSRLFDPVGSEAVNDGEVLPQMLSIRARIEDRGNWAPGLTVERLSGIDLSSVDLLVVPAANGPLVVSTDMDDMCDELNPALQPTSSITMSNQALAVRLVNIPRGGLPDYTERIVSPAQKWQDLGCREIGDLSPTPPGPLCPLAQTLMTFAMPAYADPLLLSSIWAIPPVTTLASECVGYQLDSLNTIPDGPACISVRARDNAGNVNVAPPLRICINHTGGGATGPCAGFNPNTLNCTGKWDQVNQRVIMSSTCTPHKSTEVITDANDPYKDHPVYDTRFPRKLNPDQNIMMNGTFLEKREEEAYEVRNQAQSR